MRLSIISLAVVMMIALCQCHPKTLFCSFDTADFKNLVHIVNMDYSQVSPEHDYEYWELVEANKEQSKRIGSAGDLCASASDRDTCTQDFQQRKEDFEQQDKYHVTPGFCWHSHPTDLIFYIVASDGDSVEFISDVEGVANFLGTIETTAELALLLRSLCYHWDYTEDLNDGGVLELDDGFEVIVMDPVSGCDPIQTDRVRLHVSNLGEISEQERCTAELLNGWCS